MIYTGKVQSNTLLFVDLFESFHNKCIKRQNKTKLRTKARNDIEKDWFKLMNNLVLRKLWKMSGNTEISNL